MSPPKTILFLGATGGCGLAALRKSLAAGHTCVAVCRTPSKLAALLLPSTSSAGGEKSGDQLLDQARQTFPNLQIHSGNAHDTAAVARALVPAGGRPVDAILFSIGGGFDWGRLTLDDPEVCGKGMTALVDALKQVRSRSTSLQSWQPRVFAISTTGISDQARDVPMLFLPLYHWVLKVPHIDKRKMEEALMASPEPWTIVRPSLLSDGAEHSIDKVRVGVEDPVAGKLESRAVGYTISRDDVGLWIFERLIEEKDERFVRKAVAISY